MLVSDIQQSDWEFDLIEREMGMRSIIAEAVKGSRIQWEDKDEWVFAGKGNISSSEMRAKGSWGWVILRWREEKPRILILSSLRLLGKPSSQVISLEGTARSWSIRKRPKVWNKALWGIRGGQLENNTKYVGILNTHWGPTRWLRSTQHQYPDLVRFDRPQDFQEEGLGTVKGARRSRQIERDVMSELWWWSRKKRGGEDVSSMDISGRIAGSEVLAVDSFER